MPFDLSEAELRNTEREIGATFPDSYRARMKLDNGGEFELMDEYWFLIAIRDTTNRKRLSRTASHVLSETTSFAEFPNWPDDAVAIAQNGSGDALIMKNEDARLGPHIYFWPHETGEVERVVNEFNEIHGA